MSQEITTFPSCVRELERFTVSWLLPLYLALVFWFFFPPLSWFLPVLLSSLFLYILLWPSTDLELLGSLIPFPVSHMLRKYCRPPRSSDSRLFGKLLCH